MNMVAFLKTAMCTLMALSFMMPIFAQGISEVISLREVKLKEDAHPVIFTTMMNIQRREPFISIPTKRTAINATIEQTRINAANLRTCLGERNETAIIRTNAIGTKMA